MLCSLAADLGVTQLVNGHDGVLVQARWAVRPIQASTPAMRTAAQLTHTGTVVLPIVKGHPANARAS